MTEPETLTAAERALLEHAASVTSCRIDGRVVARWMHCHDAALSTIRAADVAKEAAIADSVALLKRAQQAELARDAALARVEAAEKRFEQAVTLAMGRASAESFYAEVGARKAAESRLAEATALLERCADELVYDEFDDPVQRQLEHDVKAFVSATPAPAATVEPENPEAESTIEHAALRDWFNALPEPFRRDAVCWKENALATDLKRKKLATLVERIEAECNNKLLCAGDLADNILALIRAAKDGA